VAAQASGWGLPGVGGSGRGSRRPRRSLRSRGGAPSVLAGGIVGSCGRADIGSRGEPLGAAWGRRFGPWQSTSAIGAPPFVLAGGIVGSCGRRVRWSVAVCLFLFLFRGGEGETVIFFLFRCFSLLLSFEHKRKKMVVLFFCIA